MPDCPCIQGCPFFNNQMANMPALSKKMQDDYCKKDNSNCARYIVFSKLGKEKVPPDLFPNDVDRAKKVLAEAGVTIAD